MIYLLVFLLLNLVCFLIVINRTDFNEPSLVFTISFLLLSISAAINAKYWLLDLHENTFFVVLLGVLEFVLVSLFIKYLYKKINHNDVKKNTLCNYDISNVKIIIFIIMSLVIFVLYLNYIVKSVGGNLSSIDSISQSIEKYSLAVKFNQGNLMNGIPSWVTVLKDFIVYSGYFFTFLLINNKIVTKKYNKLLIIQVLICLMISMLGGSRAPAFNIILAGISYYLLLQNKKNGLNEIISLDTIKKVFIVCFAIVIVFLPLANLLGRNVNREFTNYLSLYCGAELKNLDDFIQIKDNTVKNEIFGSQTFVNIVQFVNRRIHHANYDYMLDLPFNYSNGHSLGNVYTVLYPFIYDFGYKGVFFLVMLMAIISQIVYEHAKKSNEKNKVSISILIYGFIFSCLALSFFSNKFYERLFSPAFARTILTWIICNYYFNKLKIKI